MLSRLVRWVSACSPLLACAALIGCTLDTQGAGTDNDAGFADARPDQAACDASSKSCNSACVSRSDPAFGCADDTCAPCSLPNAVPVCSHGACSVGSCKTGWGDCNGSPSDGCETDLRTLSHCGACGLECSVAHGSASCASGACQKVSCDDGFADCNDELADGCEANLSSVAHCGQCGNSCSTDGGAQPSCKDGVCGMSSCPLGFEDCNGSPSDGCETPIDTPTDCGGCAIACALPHASAACVQGSCVVAQCQPPFGNCDGIDGNGCELDVSMSVSHCGSCASPCSSDHGTSPACVDGKCSLTCDDGYTDCDGPAPGASDNGCEADFDTSVDACGACGRACSSEGIDEKLCVGGVCTSTCAAGRGNCSRPGAPDPDDGCETDVSSDEANCGACAATCETSHAVSSTCEGGACVFACEAGFADCNGPQPAVLDDGCEAELAKDPANCGACGSACPLPFAVSAGCSEGKCSYLCLDGFADCNGPQPPSQSDGCELPVSSDPSNCGACGHLCSKDHASSAGCVAGACVPTCVSGWHDCGTPSPPLADDGCEADFASDPMHCGGCDLACGINHVAQNLCSAGACAPVCASGWGDCDQSPAKPGGSNGCEADLNTSVDHCGRCGRGCSGDHVDDKSCSGGVCNSSCDFSWKNCVKPGPDKADDGCETFGLVCL